MEQRRNWKKTVCLSYELDPKVLPQNKRQQSYSNRKKRPKTEEKSWKMMLPSCTVFWDSPKSQLRWII